MVVRWHWEEYDLLRDADYHIQQLRRWPRSCSKEPRTFHREYQPERGPSLGPLRRWCLASTLLLQRYLWRIQRNFEGAARRRIGTHYHVGTVHGYTMRGHWRYLEHDWIAKPGTYIYEPAGEAHTLVITDDSPEPMMTMFVVGGGLIYLDKPEHGGFAAYEDGFTLLELCRKYYRDAGLDARQLDLLIR